MRRRLILLVGATTSLVLVAFLVPLALLVRWAAADQAVDAAKAEVQSLTPAVASADYATLRLQVAQINATAPYKVTVFLPDGTTLGQHANRSAAVHNAESGHSLTVTGGGGREIFTAVSGLPAGTAVIRAYVSPTQLDQDAHRAWLILFLVGVVLLGLSLVVADWLGRSLVRPLTSVVAVSHELASGHLEARATPDGPPDIREVGSALNLLADQIGTLLDRERQTAADLSHRLRTPLTALRIDAESLGDTGERARILHDVDTLVRSVDEVIRSARGSGSAGASCDAVDVVGRRATFWSALADEEHRRLAVHLPDQALPVALGEDELAACIDALLGNVFAHTPEGAGFTVTLCGRPGGGARLVVADEGPGLPDTTTGPARGPGSTGLGLDIVRRTAASCGGGVTLGHGDHGGAVVTVDLGGLASDPPAAARLQPAVTPGR